MQKIYNLKDVKKYSLKFDFNLDNKIFRGEEEIILVLEKEIEDLVLDCKDLKIINVFVNGDRARFKLEKDKLRIKNNFKKENSIKIEFEGKLIEKLGGIYLSKYQEGGREKYLITTQFEPNDARSAFPCIDHPSYKAIFEITLIFPKELKAISNTLPLKEETKNNKKIVQFKPTPRMSTYLLYLGVGDFEFLEDKYKNILLRIVTTKGKSRAGKFALECTKKFLSYMENFFGEKYPLEKLDLIAVPDFAFGAMENWGAITFRENLLLFFENITPQNHKPIIAEVIAHELTHMWFGNLVTMKWWDDLWLNESFANYLAYKAVDKYFPKWEMLKNYVFDDQVGAFARDKLIATHSIKVNVKKPEEISEIFDEISYNKGGSILKMINNFLGDQMFSRGLKYYIKSFKYQNAEANDLWKSLEKVSGRVITKIMNDFITKKNFPIVYVSKNKNKFILEQKKFTIWKDFKDKWTIPLVIKTNKNLIKTIFSKEKINISNNYDYLIVNKDFNGFYLVDYSQDLTEKILKVGSELDVLLLLLTKRYLVLRNEINLNNFYDYLEKVINYRELKDNKRLFNLILSFLDKDFVFLDWQQSKILGKTISEKILNWLKLKPQKDELPIETSLRNNAILFKGYFEEDEKIIDWAEKEFKKFINNPKSISPEIKVPVFSIAINQNKKFIEFLKNYYEKSEIITEKRNVLFALGGVKDKNELKKVFDYVFSEKVRLAQKIYFFASLNSNYKNKEIIFEEIEKRWEKIFNPKTQKDTSFFMRLLEYILPFSGTFVEEKRVDNFFKKYKLDKFKITIDYLKELIKLNKKYIQNYR